MRCGMGEQALIKLNIPSFTKHRCGVRCRAPDSLINPMMVTPTRLFKQGQLQEGKTKVFVKKLGLDKESAVCCEEKFK